MTSEEMEAEINARVEQRLAAIHWPLTGVLIIAGFVHFYVLVFIIPKFKVLFDEMDIGELPRPTIFVVAVSSMTVHYWYLVIPACIGVLIAVHRSRHRLTLLAGICFVLLAAFSVDVIV